MPRATAPNAGLRGPARTFAPAGAREAGRALALNDVADLYVEVTTKDAGGADVTDDQLVASDLPARIDPIGDAVGGRLVGEQVDETSTHVVSLAAGTQLSTGHKVALDSTGAVRWAVVALRRVSDPLLVRAEVRGA